MNNVCSLVVPVDGSAHSDRAVGLVVRLHARLAPVKIHLLHVVAPMVSGVSPPAVGEDYAFARARALLDAASIPYTPAVRHGYVAAEIVAYAKQQACDGIVMGTRGMGSSEELLGSIARQVIRLADMPITLAP